MLAVGALLPIVDPLGGAPIYLAMTANLTSAERIRMAKSVAINSFLLLIASALIGAYVLDFFGLSVPAVQVAGGIVVCMIGWSLLNSPDTPPAVERSGAPAATPDDLSRRAFYPMTMPLTVGPGSISVALTLGANPPRGISAPAAHGAGARARHPAGRSGRLPVLPLRRSHSAQIGLDRHQRSGAPVRIHPAVYRCADLLERNPRAHCPAGFGSNRL